jgi:hypothetical protein
MADENLLQRDLGRTLREWRKRRGWTVEQTTWILGTSKDIISSYETGKLRYMEPGIVESWLRECEAPQSVIDDAKAKARRIRLGSPANWIANAPRGFTGFINLEPMASALDIYEDAHITGLFQTRACAEAVMAVNPFLKPQERRDAVDFRMSRPDTVFKRLDGPPRMRVIQSEASLTQFQGMPFYGEQIARLHEMNRIPDVEIFVLPTGLIHPSMGWSYEIMSFDNRDDPDVVYQSTITGTLYEADKAIVARCRSIFTETLTLVEPLEEWSPSDAEQ